MDKRGEIPGRTKSERSFKNAAPKDDVLKLRDEMQASGVDWHVAAQKAGLSRNTGYTLLRGEGSLGSLREMQEWWAKESQGRRSQPQRGPREEWSALADELEALGPEELARTIGPEELARTIEGLQEYIRAEKRRRAALRKMFRATPDE